MLLLIPARARGRKSKRRVKCKEDVTLHIAIYVNWVNGGAYCTQNSINIYAVTYETDGDVGAWLNY